MHKNTNNLNYQKMWPLRRLLIVPGMVITATLSAIFFGVITLYSYNNLRQSFSSQFSGIGFLFTQSVTNPILLGQHENVYRLCKLVKAQESVISVVVRTPTETICALNDRSPPSKLWRQTYDSQILFGVVDSGVAATVQVVFDLNALRLGVISWAVLGFSLATILILTHALLYLILSRQVADPISSISKTIETGDPIFIAENLAYIETNVIEVANLNSRVRSMGERIMFFQKEAIQREREKVTSDLAQQIAHDIRSPLSALKIISSVKVKIPEDVMSVLKSAVARIEKMADDLLLKSRGAISAQNFQDAFDAIKILLVEFELRAELKKVRLFLSEPDEASGKVMTNIPELQRVIMNLLENSLAVSEEESSIKVSIEIEEYYYKISVIDEGPGFPTDLLPSIGKFRVKSRKPTGEGIGLVGVYATLQSWGGKVDIASDSSGAKVSIFLLKASV